MGSNVADKILKAGEAEGSETNIEIKIKTLDSQIYTLRVDKQVISGSHWTVAHVIAVGILL